MSTVERMRAIVYSQTGPSSVLRLVEREVPEPGPGEVRVRLVRAGVNPTDWKFRAGMMSGWDEVTPGQDGAGVVDAVGEGVGHLHVGDRVWLLLAQHGRLQDTAAVDATLRKYEIARYRFVRAREILADALYEVFRAAEPGTRAIRAGIMRYWQDSEHARARSMALLSGADSRLSVFLREYLTVVKKSSAAAWSTPNERGAALLGLGTKSVEKMRLVARDIGQEARRALVG